MRLATSNHVVPPMPMLLALGVVTDDCCSRREGWPLEVAGGKWCGRLMLGAEAAAVSAVDMSGHKRFALAP